MAEQAEQKPRRKASVYTRPNQSDLATNNNVPRSEYGDGGGGHHQWEGRSRKVSFGSSGRPRNVSVGSMEGADLRTRKQSFGDQERSRKISTSRRTLTVDERGWGTDGTSIRGASAASLPKPNTYKMNPERSFREKPIKEVIENVLEDMDDVRYESPSTMAAKARTISETVKQRVKLIGFDRYKLVCVVCLGQKKGQEVQDVGRCLWDSSKDGFVSVAYENATLFVIVSVYAIYQE